MIISAIWAPPIPPHTKIKDLRNIFATEIF